MAYEDKGFPTLQAAYKFAEDRMIHGSIMQGEHFHVIRADSVEHWKQHYAEIARLTPVLVITFVE